MNGLGSEKGPAIFRVMLGGLIIIGVLSALLGRAMIAQRQGRTIALTMSPPVAAPLSRPSEATPVGTPASVEPMLTPTLVPSAAAPVPTRRGIGLSSPEPLTPAPSLGTRVPAMTAASSPILPRVVLVPILAYHNFDQKAERFSVQPAVFRSQLAALKAAGFTGVTLHQIAAALHDGRPLPAHPIAITLDDARATQLDALRILREEGFTATLFVPTGWHELSRQEIIQLDRDGFEIDSHTVWHPDLVRTPARIEEVGRGKAVLERWLGHSVAGFAYPFGAYDPVVVAAVQQAGFEYAVTTQQGVVLSWTNRYLWPRIPVDNVGPRVLLARLAWFFRRAEAGQEPPAPPWFG